MTMTIKEFILTADVTMTAVPTTHNPNMHDMIEGSGHYVVTLKVPAGREMTLVYSVGPGILETWAWSPEGKRKAYPRIRRAMTFLGGNKPPYPQLTVLENNAYQLIMTWAREAYRPALADVLGCLASDAQTVRNARYFEEWARDLGYGEDSRKAEAIYRTCERQAAELEDMLGHGAFETLLNDVERE